jgi:CRP/FNR family transcriptional regulator
VVWLAKRNYGGALVDALRDGHPSIFFSEEEPFSGFQKDAVAVSTAIAGISDPDLRVRRIAAEILGNLSLTEATDALVKALDDPDVEVRVALLRSLAKANAAHALLDINIYLQDPEPEVRLQSIRTLAQLAPYAKGLIAHVQPLLDDTDSRIRSTAASTLLNLGPHNKAFNILNEMIRSPKLQTQILALEAFADWGGEAAYDLVTVYLDDPSANIRRKALVAINHIDPQRSLDRLIEALGDEDRFVVETSATEFKKAGPEAFKRLIEALNDSVLEEGALQALEHLPFRREADLIRQYARVKVAEMKRYDALHRQAEQQNRNMKYYELLLESIQNCARIQGIYALKSVGLIEDIETVALAIECLNTEDTEQKANALEMLDSIGEREIVSQVLQHWERASTGVEKDIRASEPDQSSWMIRILQDQDPWLRACAVLIITDPEGPQMHDMLEHLASDPDSLVRETALNALKGGVEMKTLPTLSLMERIIFLRRVPIFSQLPPAELKQIAAICVEQDFLDGEIFAQEGELGDEMFIIVSGEIRVVTGGEQGPGIELARRRSGDYVGEMAIISNEPRMATLIADGNTRTLCISQKQFEQILRQRPETSLAVMRVLCSRLREAQNP